MKRSKKVISICVSACRSSLKTWHGRFVLAGLTLGFVYLPVWLSDLVVRGVQGSVGLPFVIIAVYLASSQIWNKRHELGRLEAAEADQLLGHLFIVCSIILFPFCRFALWPQALLWFLTLIGIAISSWGINFLWKNLLSVFLIAITYPRPSTLFKAVWQALTPPEYLERVMAWSGAAGLRIIGLPAVSNGTLVILPPDGAVDVYWGCNGLTMAYTMAAAGLALGIFLKQRWPTLLLMVVVGAVLALIFNVPRIMLLAVASIIWGESAFNFWHGFWGGQVFISVLFTFYYYAVMAILNRRSRKSA